MNISLSTVLTIIIIFIVYILVLWGLIVILFRLKIPSSWAIITSFLIFATGTGLWTASTWHLDSSVLINLPATLFGDYLYQWSIQHLGDPSSFQAHYTIPWLLRVPQVYIIASIILWGFLGLVIQLFYNYWHQIASGLLCHRKGEVPQ